MFPGATTDRDAASYVVVGAPLDATTTFQPGTRFGPDRIRRFAETYDDYDRRTDSDFSALGVCDAGDVRSWDDVKEYLDHLAAELRSVTRALDDLGVDRAVIVDNDVSQTSEVPGIGSIQLLMLLLVSAYLYSARL